MSIRLLKMKEETSSLWRHLFAGLVMVVGMWKMVYAAHNKTTTTTTTVENVGVVLDLSSSFGKMALSCIDMSLSDFDASHPHRNTTIVLHVKDSKGDVVEAASQAMELIQKSEVKTILGPERWSESYFIMKLGEKAKIPIISFAPTSSNLNSLQVHAISDIIKTFKWQQVVAIYQDDEFGNWLVPDLTNALLDMYVHVHRSVIDLKTSSYQIKQQLYRLSSMRAARVFVVHVDPNVASRVFAAADELGMMREGYAWILTHATSNVLSSLNSSILSSMQGVLGLKSYVPRTEEIHNFTTRWRSKFKHDNPSIDHPEMDVYGLWAYDATRALAIAVERIGTDNTNLRLNSKKIRESLLFKGLSGESSNLEIVNVIGNREIRIGYWKPEMGLTGEFNRKRNLRTIIWPGYSISAPMGWEILKNSKKKLRIGVALNDEFSEFARVENGSMVGYCIDIFEAVVAQLPYHVSYHFVPFEDNFSSSSSSSSSYDNLIMQVFEQKYDGAIGDITILANRSLYVDFTLPFTEAGIGMVVPVKQNLGNHSWVFLKPFTLNLWIVSLVFFILMAFVVWILEHQIHGNISDPSSFQIRISLFSSFCTIIFARWETLANNLAKFVVVVWFFVLFIVAQSYTASLTSWLTVQQLRPVTDMNQIKKNNWHVGYQNGSYVFHTLQRMGIKNLVPYSSLEQLHQLFTNESRKGGIDAVIDEIPYMKLFLSKYHDNYIMADSAFKGNGFGFAFSLGSSIVEDMSKAVLNVTESNKMIEIQEKWFENKIGHQSCSTKDSSSLNLTYFWGLYLIAVSAAFFALFAYFCLIFYRRRRSFDSTWKKILTTFNIFKLKDEGREGGIDVEPSVVEARPPSPFDDDSIHCPECYNDDLSHPNQASLEPIHG